MGCKWKGAFGFLKSKGKCVEHTGKSNQPRVIKEDFTGESGLLFICLVQSSTESAKIIRNFFRN